jgi:tetratricopeptide (TPR) repeat protein
MNNPTDPQPGILPGKPTVSVCMIVRDEEEALPRCLKSLQNVVDELIVVDTGSKDNTIRIAEHFDGRIFHFKWRDDFSAARNESLKHATGDWILQLDADEELLPASVPHLKESMSEPSVLLYLVRFDNGVKCRQVRFVWLGRLFRNQPKLRYHRPYHETIDESVDEVMSEETGWNVRYEPSIVIRHYGYEHADMLNKWERGFRIMKSHLNENPKDAYILTKMGGVCSSLGRHDEAETYLNKALRIDPDYSEAYFRLGVTLQKQGKVEAAIRCYEKAISIDPDEADAELYANLGVTYIQKGMLDPGMAKLGRALDINPELALAHSQLGTGYQAKGMLDEAIREYELALAIDSELAESHNNLAVAYFLKRRYELAVEHCDKALELGFRVHPAFLQELKRYRLT